MVYQERARRADPANHIPLVELAIVHFWARRPNDATRYIDAAIVRFPDFRTLYNIRLNVYKSLGDTAALRRLIVQNVDQLTPAEAILWQRRLLMVERRYDEVIVQRTKVWGRQFDSELNARDIFAIQTEIVERVASELNLRFDTEHRRHTASIQTESFEALEAYHAGLVHANRPGHEYENRLATQSFEFAVSLDPEFAAAWDRLARSRTVRSSDRPSRPGSVLLRG